MLSAAKGSVGEALKLLNYGGGEIIAAYDEMLAAEGPTARKAMHRLADALSGRESDTIFDFFVSHVGDDIMNRARAAAGEGQIAAAERLARLYSEITERLTISDGYNFGPQADDHQHSRRYQAARPLKRVSADTFGTVL